MGRFDRHCWSGKLKSHSSASFGPDLDNIMKNNLCKIRDGCNLLSMLTYICLHCQIQWYHELQDLHSLNSCKIGLANFAGDLLSNKELVEAPYSRVFAEEKHVSHDPQYGLIVNFFQALFYFTHMSSSYSIVQCVKCLCMCNSYRK